MKIIFLIVSAITFLPVKIFSQQSDTIKQIELDAFYNWSMTGQNISLMANKPFNRHHFSFGLKYHNNPPASEEIYLLKYAYKNRFREYGIREAIGLNLGYRFDFVKKNEIVNPYLFYLLQVSYLRHVPGGYILDTNGTIIGTVIEKPTHPFYIFEHAIGIGLQTRLFKNFYLNQSAGLGWAHFYKTPDISYTIRYGGSDAVTLIRIGMTYKIQR